MIEINDRFSITRDKYCWHLLESYDGMTKKGVPVRKTTTTYHPNLTAVCDKILDKSAGSCDSIECVIQEVRLAMEECVKAIKAKNNI